MPLTSIELRLVELEVGLLTTVPAYLRGSILESSPADGVAEAPLAPGGHVAVGRAGHDARLLLVGLLAAVPVQQ